MIKKLIFLFSFFYTVSLFGQGLVVTNQKGKDIHTFKQGKSLDFRVDYNVLYPGKNDSILESRVYGIIDTIIGKEIKLSEVQVILDFSKDNVLFLEEPYEYTDLTLTMDEIKSLSYTPVMQSVGSGLFTVGLAALIVSPLFGFLTSSDGYATSSVTSVALVGVGAMAIGGTFYLTFKQKPFKFKDFNGPNYFKKYQPGTLSVVE